MADFKKYIKQKIRYLIVNLNQITEKWVVPDYVFKLIDDGNYKKAEMFLDIARLEWDRDPHVVYASSLLAFLTMEEEHLK